MTSPIESNNNRIGDVDNLGVKDVNATGQGCSCGKHSAGCTCGHHQTCDCAPGECKCEQHNDENADHVCAKCNCPADECGCEHHHSCGCSGEEAGKDFSNPDTVNPDGTNPAVQTVNKAEGYNEDAGWNDGIAPRESDNPQSYEKDDKNVN